MSKCLKREADYQFFITLLSVANKFDIIVV